MVCDKEWPAQLNRLIWEKRKELHHGSDGSLPPLVTVLVKSCSMKVSR